MKKSIVFCWLLIIFSFIFSKPIDESTAMLAGKNFLISKTSKSKINLQLVYKSVSNNNSPDRAVYFYVFSLEADGFVIVSGNDDVTPILAYSDQNNFNPNNIAPNTLKWLEGYKNEIRNVIEHKIEASSYIQKEWQALLQNKYQNVQSRISSVSPLIQTRWNQSPYVNDLCPYNSVTGCVATAMAQIMKFWNYPASGSGFHSYNHQSYGTLSANYGNTTYQWASMPNYVNSTNNAVATLMYQVGVSVNMNYSPEVSGAYVIENSPTPQACSEYALKTYFGYKSTLKGIERDNYTQTQWMNTIKTELNAGRPVLYAGFGSGGGHCFVADGYDNNDYIHFNWGWGGAYDGYFHVNALNPSGTGTGGGSGGYNSGQQAVIGIEPPSNSVPVANIGLYNYVTPSASTISYGQSFTISTNLINNGSTTFAGDYCAAVFDNNSNFVDYVEIKTGNNLQAGYHYTNNLVFSNSGMFGMIPGVYKVIMYYKATGGNWVIVGNSGSYTNSTTITVVNQNSIALNSSMSVLPSTTITQGQSASVKLNIKNDGASTFLGQYQVALYNLDGSFAESIGIYNETSGLQSGYTYLSPYLTFGYTPITVEPGTYLVAIQYKPNGGNWKLVGADSYTNPIKITVVTPTIQPDQYESNNTVSQSHNLPISFSGNSTNKNTIGSNCHIVTDNDYYKIALPSGYNYTILPRLHDSYNSGNGNTYTLDGLFSYSTDGVTWSDTYDDVLGTNIAVNGGKTIYFHVAPYFAGATGTYLLDMNISRTVVSGIKENLSSNLITVYPNPAIEYITIDFKDLHSKINQIQLFNVQGQQVKSINDENFAQILKLPLDDISNGIYFLHLDTKDGLLVKKIVIER